MRSLPLRLDEPLSERLREYTHRKRVSQSAVIRRALSAYLDQEEAELRRQRKEANG